MNAIQKATYEHPNVVALGPLHAALMAGYAVMWLDGQIYLTPEGEKYIEYSPGTEEELER